MQRSVPFRCIRGALSLPMPVSRTGCPSLLLQPVYEKLILRFQSEEMQCPRMIGDPGSTDGRTRIGAAA